MRVLITGATGFIGRALVEALRREGHEAVAWCRSEPRARAVLGGDIDTVWAGAGHDALSAALARCDGAVNLAGEPIVGRRWTRARRSALAASRVDVTAALVRAIAAAHRPMVLVSGSAVGYYGDRGAEVLTEDSDPGRGTLADLCRRWEAAALEARALGVRVVTVRTGIVIGRGGGALKPMLPAFRMGLGGPVGSGRQYLSWVHLHDLVAILLMALAADALRGPVNAVAPQPVTSREFARALGRALGRPARLPAPAFALRLIFGESATVLLSSQRVVPAALERAGFGFSFPDLDAALAEAAS